MLAEVRPQEEPHGAAGGLGSGMPAPADLLTKRSVSAGPNPGPGLLSSLDLCREGWDQGSPWKGGRRPAA